MTRKTTGPEIERLIGLLARLPGLGHRSARKAALTLLKRRVDLLQPLAAALADAAEKIVTCTRCGNIDTVTPCTICLDPARDGSLIVNVGSNTDRCEKDSGRDPTVRFPCPEIDGDRPNAALWRIKLAWPEGKVVGQEVIARGLRNSMALAVSPSSGALLQAENSIDLEPEDEPPEEINVVIAGKHYGWPYSHGAEVPDPVFYTAMPPGLSPVTQFHGLGGHVAPLSIRFLRNQGETALNGAALVAEHGS